MTVRIYTDASIKVGRGAWATVIIREACEPVEEAGALRGHFASSTAVEAAAMANALHTARRRGLIMGGDRVVLICDNQAAVMRINGELSERATRKADPAIIRAAGYALDLAATIGIDLAAEWVKGHQRLDSDCPHAFHNRRCDMLCAAIRDGRPTPSIKPMLDQYRAHQNRKAGRKAKGRSNSEALA